MAFLEKFSPQEQDTLVSLPYRAGLWVSRADQTGGTHAQAQEREVLEKIIMIRAKGMFESAFVHEIMAEAVARKDRWRDWDTNLERVTIECNDAADILIAKLSRHDADAYRKAVMTIGLEVARKFREYDAHAGVFSRLLEDVRLCLLTCLRGLADRNYRADDHGSVSYDENKVLAALASALRVSGQAPDIIKN